MRLSAMSSIMFCGLFMGGVSLLPVSAQAEADFGGGWTVNGNAALTSEYSFRGIAQSDERPALQGGIDLGHESGFYAGFWGSNVDFNDGDEATVEIDSFAGYSGDVMGITYDVGGIYYAYPGANNNLNYDFIEGAVGLGYDFEWASLAASINYSPNFFADSGSATYIAGAVDIPVMDTLTINLHAGYQWIEENRRFGAPDYLDYLIGASYSVKGATVSAHFIDTTASESNRAGECRDGCAERIITTLSYAF